MKMLQNHKNKCKLKCKQNMFTAWECKAKVNCVIVEQFGPGMQHELCKEFSSCTVMILNKCLSINADVRISHAADSLQS